MKWSIKSVVLFPFHFFVFILLSHFFIFMHFQILAPIFSTLKTNNYNVIYYFILFYFIYQQLKINCPVYTHSYTKRGKKWKKIVECRWRQWWREWPNLFTMSRLVTSISYENYHFSILFDVNFTLFCVTWHKFSVHSYAHPFILISTRVGVFVIFFFFV